MELTWTGAADLDLGLMPPSGRYTTWLGGERGASFHDVVSRDGETMALKSLDSGTWLIDVVRRDGGSAPVEVSVVVKARGSRKTLTATLVGKRVALAEVKAD